MSNLKEARPDKAEILAKAKDIMARTGESVSGTAKILGIPMSTLHTWIGKEKKRAEKAQEVLTAVEPAIITDKPLDELTVADVCLAELNEREDERMSQYEPEENDYTVEDEEPVPYTTVSSLDLAIESSFARAKIKVEKLMKDPVALALMKDLIQAGVL